MQRFCQTLGFSGYKEFKYEFLAEEGRAPTADDQQDVVAETTASLAEAIADIAQIEQGDTYGNNIVELIVA